MDRSLHVTLLVAVLVVFASSFAFADFAAGTTRTAVDAQTGTGSMGDATLPSPQPVVLHVATDDALSRRIGERFAAALEARGYAVTTTDTLRGDYDAPVFVVGVTERSLRYNPVTPSATLRFRFLLVDSGNLSRIGQAEAFDAARFRENFLADESGAVRLDDETRYVSQGTLEVDVRQTGAVSYPHFRGVVVETTVDAAVERIFAS